MSGVQALITDGASIATSGAPFRGRKLTATSLGAPSSPRLKSNRKFARSSRQSVLERSQEVHVPAYKEASFCQIFFEQFLSKAVWWYKIVILVFLVINIPLALINKTVAAWVIVLEFIFTLAMALTCYPLQPGGMLAIEAILLGLIRPDGIFHEIERNLDVILLLIFMVAATHFLKPLLLQIFTAIIAHIRNKTLLCLAFLLTSAILSAFLDALTVTAVLIHVVLGLLNVHDDLVSFQNQRAMSLNNDDSLLENIAVGDSVNGDGQKRHFFGEDFDPSLSDQSSQIYENHTKGQSKPTGPERQQFIAFLRDLTMHGILGTALGGGLTQVGEPQNLIVADFAGWNFVEYFLRLFPVSVPVFFSGIIVMIILEKTKRFGYGNQLPERVRTILINEVNNTSKKSSRRDRFKIFVQSCVCIFIVIGLGFHLAAVGLIGLGAIILVTTFLGIVDEVDIGKAFQDSLPFTALLCVFFAIVSMMDDLDLFKPIIQWILSIGSLQAQLGLFFVISGALSTISDNVFVATIFIVELFEEFEEGTISNSDFDLFAVSVNSGTNVLSIATPNGQAAFLFLLTSLLATKLKLTYPKMVWMALPYTVLMSVIGIICNFVVLAPFTDIMLKNGVVS